jgi:glycosyltransferase involved in cell wall biosynthesis
LVTPFPPEKCGIAVYSWKLARRLARYVDLLVIGNDSANGGLQPDGNLRIVRAWKRNSPRYLFNIMRQVAREAPDVVHVQHEYLGYGARKYGLLFPGVLLLIRLLGRPVVVTMHSVVRRDALTSDFFFIHQAGHRFVAAKRLLMTIITRLIVNFSDIVVVHSREMKYVLCHHYDIDASKIIVLPHGADISLFRNTEGGNPFREKLKLEGKIILLFFGFVIPGKGVEVLLSSFSKALEENPNMALVIAGGYHPRLRAEFPRYIGSVEKLVDELGLSRDVIFSSRFLGAEELKEYISRADIVVFPYVDDSVVGVSGALADCAGMGKAIIATRIPRFASEIENGVNGVLVKPGDERALTSAIVTLARNPALRTQIAENLLQSSMSRDWEKIALRTCELYSWARGTRNDPFSG